MINIVIQEELYDKELVDRWCVGFEALKEHVQEFTVERAAAIAWVPEEKILEATRLLAKTRPSCFHTRLGSTAQQINASQTARAITILLALIGDIDIPGGNL